MHHKKERRENTSGSSRPFVKTLSADEEVRSLFKHTPNSDNAFKNTGPEVVGAVRKGPATCCPEVRAKPKPLGAPKVAPAAFIGGVQGSVAAKHAKA